MCHVPVTSPDEMGMRGTSSRQVPATQRLLNDQVLNRSSAEPIKYRAGSIPEHYRNMPGTSTVINGQTLGANGPAGPKVSMKRFIERARESVPERPNRLSRGPRAGEGDPRPPPVARA
jgi:hypothetical protein